MWQVGTEQQQQDKSFVLPTTRFQIASYKCMADKASALWLPTKQSAQSHGRAALGASGRSERRSRAIAPLLVMLGTSRGITSVV